MKYVSARTKFPNTPESDRERLVMHVVTATDVNGKEVFLELLAEDPIDAINKSSKFPAETWNPISKLEYPPIEL